ncbi:MAG: DUF2127 domain-containing protein [Burkholderiaceae bacterium]
MNGRALRAVAAFEAAKGVIVLAAASGLLALIHRDVHAAAATLIEHLHLNPASHYPRVFLDAAEHLQDARLLLLAAGAAVYAAVRLAEAYGLWYGRAWAEVLAAASGAIYVPFEVWEFFRRPTVHGGVLFVLNVAIVALTVRALQQRRRIAPVS